MFAKKLDLQILKNAQVAAILSSKKYVLKDSRNFHKANKNCDNLVNFRNFCNFFSRFAFDTTMICLKIIDI